LGSRDLYTENMVMKMMINFGKRGQFLSIMTILMILPLVLLSIAFGETMGGYGSDIGQQVRLKSGYYHYHSLEQDLSRSSEKIGRRSLFSSVGYVIEAGEGLNSSSDVLGELFVDGSIHGEPQLLMNRSGIEDWLRSVERISSQRGYEVILNMDEPKPEMKDSYTVSLGFNYTLEMSDSGGAFGLAKDKYNPNEVSLKGLEDPLVALGTGGRLSTFIEPCDFNYTSKKLAEGVGNNSWGSGSTVFEPISGEVDNKETKVLVVGSLDDYGYANRFSGVVVGEGVDDDLLEVPYVSKTDTDLISDGIGVVVEGVRGEVWELDNLYRMWNETCYMPGEKAPSFLDRLENNPDARSEQGLNVLLKKTDLDREGLEVKNKSNVAHIYFSKENVKDCNVKGMPKSFRIDAPSSEDIGLSDALHFDC